MNARVADVLRAVHQRVADESWQAGAARIARERADIEAYLDRGGAAYGFSTRLGHLDDQAADEAAQRRFLDDHLYGQAFGVDVGVLRLFAAVKATQLAHGGSGVSSALYSGICAFAVADADGESEGAWLASYGAGDVVPGSWWLRAVLDRTGLELQRGDFIASVNGDFVSTGVAILALARLVDALSDYLTLLPPRPEVRSLLRSTGPVEPGAVGGVPSQQEPISLRDTTPFVTAAAACVRAVAAAIERRLARPSGNPEFRIDGGVVSPVSQNGYLDFAVTTTLSAATQVSAMAIGQVQRLVEHAATRSGESWSVQTAKVAQSIVTRAGHLQVPMTFSGSLSAGIEDMYDCSLLSAVTTLRAVALLEESLAVARSAQLPPHADAAELRRLLGDDCGVSMLPPGVAAAWTQPFVRQA